MRDFTSTRPGRPKACYGDKIRLFQEGARAPQGLKWQIVGKNSRRRGPATQIECDKLSGEDWNDKEPPYSLSLATQKRPNHPH